MSRPLFQPTLRQMLCLAAIAAAALCCGFYLRYLVMEQPSVGIACQSRPDSFTCSGRHVAYSLFTPQAFGLASLAAALLNLLRPSLVLWALALATGGIGIVLYNVALSALAVALLIVSLARPAPVED